MTTDIHILNWPRKANRIFLMLSDEQIATLTKLTSDQRHELAKREAKKGEYKNAFEIMKFDSELTNAQQKFDPVQWLRDRGCTEKKA